jgi:hypothetical protein
MPPSGESALMMASLWLSQSCALSYALTTGCRLRIPCVLALNLTASLPSGVFGPRLATTLELMVPPQKR